MRAVVDLPDDLHRVVQASADSAGISLSDAIVRLLRAAVPGSGPVRMTRSPATSLTVVSVGRTVASHDVRDLDADGW